MTLPRQLLCCLVALTAAPVCQALSCRTANGAATDWSVVLKAAGHASEAGTAYAYLDSDTTSPRGHEPNWARLENLQAARGTPLSQTLAPLYTASPGVGYILWNDEPPSSHCDDCTSFNLAHGKGVLGFDAAGGFLLLHSAPKFPDSPADAPYGGIHAPELRHAQSFVCVTLTPSAVEEVAGLLQTTNLYIYSPLKLPALVAAAFPNASLLLTQALPFKGARLNPATNRQTAELTTTGGQSLLLATHSSTGTQGRRTRLYEDMLQIELMSGLLVQTWSEGQNNDLPSYCGPPDSAFESLNVEQIEIPGTGLGWPTRHAQDRDHSKWAVTFAGEVTSRPGLYRASRAVKVVCLADQNRARTQELRGGSALCFRNDTLWEAFSAIVARVDDCQEGTQKLQHA